jgi:hypothetical protein
MAENLLVELLDDVRGKTLKVLGGLTDAQARWTPPDLQNSILWHAGHAYVVLEWLTAMPLGRPTQAPEGWYATFSWESRPAEVPADRWPGLAAVVRALREQHERFRALYASLSPEELARTAAQGPQARTAQWSMMHALVDEASHVGEMMLLRKLQGLGRMAAG